MSHLLDRLTPIIGSAQGQEIGVHCAKDLFGVDYLDRRDVDRQEPALLHRLEPAGPESERTGRRVVLRGRTAQSPEPAMKLTYHP